jgi:hypothetical protein
MTQKTKQKFATQVAPELLDAVKGIAKEEGRQVQAMPLPLAQVAAA